MKRILALKICSLIFVIVLTLLALSPNKVSALSSPISQTQLPSFDNEDDDLDQGEDFDQGELNDEDYDVLDPLDPSYSAGEDEQE